MNRLLPVILLSLGGCASPFDVSRFDDDPRRGTNLVLVSDTSPGVDPAPDSNDVLIPSEAGPDDYVRIALDRNPSIRAANRRVDRLQQRIAQARSLDDPVFRAAPVGEMAETAAGEVVLMTSLSQKLPFPGKLAARERIAVRNVAVAARECDAVRLGVIADTRRAFWSLYYTTRGIEVIEVDRRLLGQFRSIAESKYKAGAATQQDVLRASVELSNLDNELVTLRQRRTTAAAMLNRLLNRPVNAPLPEPGRVDIADVALRLDDLLAAAARDNPEIERIRERIDGYRERLALARLQRWPDVTLNVAYSAVDDDGLATTANGRDQWYAGFGVNLPVWFEKLDAAENEARQGILEGVAALADRRNDIAFRVQDALARVETQHRLATLFRDVIVPQARQTVQVSESSYRAGREDFLTVVDNWRKLLDFELMYHQSVAQLERHFAELQRVVGRDLDRQGSSRRADEDKETGS